MLHVFQGVTDFRKVGRVKYQLENILCLYLLIAMRGQLTSFLNASMFIEIKANYFVKLKLLDKKQIPSHDALRRIFMNLDANELHDVILNRIKELITKIVAYVPKRKKDGVRLHSGDGETFNGSDRNGENGKNNSNVFNLYDASSSLCLTSIPLDDKESEIPTFQSILRPFNIKNSMVTADALHCQRETARIINNRGGLYCFKVKNNQPTFKEHLIQMINLNADKVVSTFYNNCDYKIYIIDYKINDLDFPGAKAYIQFHSHKRTDQSDYNPEPQYFVSSSKSIQLIMEAIDNRWDIESGLHGWKDDFLKEDECTFTDKNAIKVMAVFNNITYALYRLASAIFDHECMAETRVRFDDCPEKMLSKLIPLTEKQNLTMLLKKSMRGYRKHAPDRAK